MIWFWLCQVLFQPGNNSLSLISIPALYQRKAITSILLNLWKNKDRPVLDYHTDEGSLHWKIKNEQNTKHLDIWVHELQAQPVLLEHCFDLNSKGFMMKVHARSKYHQLQKHPESQLKIQAFEKVDTILKKFILYNLIPKGAVVP